MRRGRRRLLTFAPIFVLAAENLVVFWRHYFGGYGFPWDFVGSYYAAAAYWTEAVSRGSLPMWMPFQSMGYPFLLNLQTGLFYPPMWLFPLLGIPYTLPAAVTFQCLHLLAGALGMYVLVLALLRSRREALLAAFCFQLFGGFYSNAEHVDIVRSFAFTPWLLWTCVPPRGAENWAACRRLWLAPLVVFAMAAGGYPGNLIAALFLLTVFAAFVLVQRGFARDAFAWAGTVATSAALGLGMAAIHLGPGWIYRDELMRYHNAARLFRASLGVAHLPGLVLENRGMPLDPSMTSTWVGFAVLAGICFLGWAGWARLWPYAALVAVAAAMAAGKALPLYAFLGRLLPPLGLSRFPSSDYRGFLGVLLILLAAAGWRNLRHRRIKATGFLLRFLPVVLFAWWSLGRLYASDAFWPDPALGVTALLATLVAFVLWRSKRLAIGLLAMLAAVAFDAARVLPKIQLWSVPDLIGTGRVFYLTPARMYDAGLVVDRHLFEPRKGPRPARIDGEGDHDPPYRSSGYLQGNFVLLDFGSSGLRARDTIAKDEGYLAYMRREWTPVVVEPAPAGAGAAVEIPDLRARAAAAPTGARVVQESLGIDHARYRVDSERPILLVENEVYFPGWSSPRAGPAIRVNGVFRGWRLPAGSYVLETRFRLRGLGALAALTAAAWLSWLAAVLALRRRSLGSRA